MVVHTLVTRQSHVFIWFRTLLSKPSDDFSLKIRGAFTYMHEFFSSPVMLENIGGWSWAPGPPDYTGIIPSTGIVVMHKQAFAHLSLLILLLFSLIPVPPPPCAGDIQLKSSCNLKQQDYRTTLPYLAVLFCVPFLKKMKVITIIFVCCTCALWQSMHMG